jgi:hypothetical protein
VDLNIYLEEGLSQDTALIPVNGEIMYHRKGVTTHAVIGLADFLRAVEIETFFEK